MPYLFIRMLKLLTNMSIQDVNYCITDASFTVLQFKDK